MAGITAQITRRLKMVKLSEIKGLMLNNKLEPIYFPAVDGLTLFIDEQGQREITLDREKLAKIEWKIFWAGDKMEHDGYCVGQPNTCYLCECYRRTDVIISNLKDIVILKEDK